MSIARRATTGKPPSRWETVVARLWPIFGVAVAVLVWTLAHPHQIKLLPPATRVSYVSVCHADAKSVAVGLEAYRAQHSKNAPDVATLVNPGAGGRYLRSLPGNVSKYHITTDGIGAALVQSENTTATYDAATRTWTGPAVDFENNTAGPGGAYLDPCGGL
jgi:hypothetical protein